MDESFEYYTKDEIDLIDRCKKITGQNLEDEEIYEIILKHKFNEPQIIDEIVGIADKLRKKGEDYEWNIVQKVKEKVPQKGPKTFYKEKNYYKNKDGKNNHKNFNKYNNNKTDAENLVEGINANSSQVNNKYNNKKFNKNKITKKKFNPNKNYQQVEDDIDNLDLESVEFSSKPKPYTKGDDTIEVRIDRRQIVNKKKNNKLEKKPEDKSNNQNITKDIVCNNENNEETINSLVTNIDAKSYLPNCVEAINNIKDIQENKQEKIEVSNNQNKNGSQNFENGKPINYSNLYPPWQSSFHNLELSSKECDVMIYGQINHYNKLLSMDNSQQNQVPNPYFLNMLYLNMMNQMQPNINPTNNYNSMNHLQQQQLLYNSMANNNINQPSFNNYYSNPLSYYNSNHVNGGNISKNQKNNKF